MKQYLIFSTFLIVSCTSEMTTRQNLTHEMDTIYNGQGFEILPKNRFVIMISDTSQNSIDFAVNRTELVKIKISRFEKYPISLKNLKNVLVENSDSLNGLFYLTPTDTSFYVEFWQDYGNDNVIMKYFEDSATCKTIPMNGHQFVGKKTFTAGLK